MKPFSKTSKFKECSNSSNKAANKQNATLKSHDMTVNKKYTNDRKSDLDRSESSSNLKGKTKCCNEKTEQINCSYEPVRKVKKVSEYNPAELMSRLEQFSDVWNDYPTGQNSKLNSNTDWFGAEDNLVENNQDKNDYIKSNKCQMKSYTVASGEKLEIATKEHEEEHVTLTHYIKSDKNKPKLHAGSLKELKDHEITGELKIQSKYDRNSADLKRIKAVQEHRQAHAEQKNIIKLALSSLDGKQSVNKKIVFNEAEETLSYAEKDNNVSKEETKAAGHQRLFDESDNSDSGSELKLNPQFEGKKGQKLLELQSKFANDSRFTLDTRFYESGSEESENGHLENVNGADEKTKQLAILESIVQREIKPLSEIKKRSSKKNEDMLLLRFDPTREDHNKYIMKPQKPAQNEEKKDKKKRSKNETIKNEQENKTHVSSEKFFAVKEDIKEVFKKENGASTEFSLLKLFGTKDAEDLKQKPGESKITNKQKSSSRNPFKYDSSDTEPDEDEAKVTDKEEECKVRKETEVKENKKVIKNPAASWRTTFFFTDNDPRLQEGMEFLKGPEEVEDNKEYAEKRKMLKVFIRKKFKNNNRKRNPFKKKLGGVKKKIFKPKKRTS